MAKKPVIDVPVAPVAASGASTMLAALPAVVAVPQAVIDAVSGAVKGAEQQEKRWVNAGATILAAYSTGANDWIMSPPCFTLILHNLSAERQTAYAKGGLESATKEDKKARAGVGSNIAEYRRRLKAAAVESTGEKTVQSDADFYIALGEKGEKRGKAALAKKDRNVGKDAKLQELVFLSQTIVSKARTLGLL